MATTARPESLWERLTGDQSRITETAFWSWLDDNTADLGVIVHPNHPDWNTPALRSPEDRYSWHIGYDGLNAATALAFDEATDFNDLAAISLEVQLQFSLGDHEVLQLQDIINWVANNDVSGPKKQDRGWNLQMFPLAMERVERLFWDKTRFYTKFAIRADI